VPCVFSSLHTVCVAALCCFFLPGKRHICRPTVITLSLHALRATPLLCFVLLNHFHSSCCLTWRVHRAPFHRQCLVFVVSPQCLSVCLEAPAAAFITLFLTRHCHRRNCYLFCASVCCCHSHTNSPQCSSTALLFGCRRRRRLPGRLTCLLCVCCLFLT